MNRFVINFHYIKSNEDNIGNTFPLQTFTTNSIIKLAKLLYKHGKNKHSGINKIVVLDRKWDSEFLSESRVGQAPIEL